MKNEAFLLINKLFKKLKLYSIRSSKIGEYVKINSGTQLVDVTFGDYSYCGYDCNIINAEIGKFCCLSDNIIIGGAEHPMHFVSMSSVFLSHRDSSVKKLGNLHYLPKVKTMIGHDVWIGNRAIIKSGVSIGTGAVIGTGSVVTKDVPEYAVVAGNPAKVIRYRFNEDIRTGLIRSEWWNLNEKSLVQLSKYFDQPQRFLEEVCI